MLEKIKQFFSSMLEKAKELVLKAAEALGQLVGEVQKKGIVETVKEFSKSRHASHVMKGWLMFDFIMDVTTFAAAWVILSGGLKFWVIFTLSIHMFQIVREFVLAPLTISNQNDDDQIVELV